MKQTRIGKTIAFLLVMITMIATGCDCPKRLEALQEQNKTLSAQVADLEKQLAQADARVAASGSQVPQQPQQPSRTPAGESIYVVVKGDNLWSIAQKQLGKGSRYEEILALNPHIQKDQPLAIGTLLKLPPR